MDERRDTGIQEQRSTGILVVPLELIRVAPSCARLSFSFSPSRTPSFRLLLFVFLSLSASAACRCRCRCRCRWDAAFFFLLCLRFYGHALSVYCTSLSVFSARFGNRISAALSACLPSESLGDSAPRRLQFDSYASQLLWRERDPRDVMYIRL